MRWPRGKYNGQRIVGLEVKVVVDIRHWLLIWPQFRYGRCLALGPVRVWLSAAYEYQRAGGPPARQES